MSTGAPQSWGFSRTSVAAQAAAALREAIRRGELRDPLPGGHELARRLGISRPTLRVALGALVAEGLIRVQKGHRSRLNSHRSRVMPRTRPTVCVVGPLTPETLFSLEHPLLLEMHAQFASRGIGWEQVFDARLGGRNPAPRLAQLVNARRQACWILFGAPEPIQRWFATADVHALVLGSGVAGLNLPSVDLDYGAIGWHAAGAILRHGHTRVALVLPARPLPGDIASREAFLRYVDQRVTGVTVTNCEAPVDPAQFRATLRRLLGSSRRPTVLLSLRPSLTLTLLTHVLGEGLRVPEDVSIVTRDTHPLIESALPELTRYISPVTKRATRTVRIASALLAGRRVQPIPSLVTASFVPGATLAAAP